MLKPVVKAFRKYVCLRIFLAGKVSKYVNKVYPAIVTDNHYPSFRVNNHSEQHYIFSNEHCSGHFFAYILTKHV